eukprot:Em0015g285a
MPAVLDMPAVLHMMALSKQAPAQKDVLLILTESPDKFEAVLFKFRVIRDLCVYSATPILKADTQRQIEQSSVDFREQTSRLSEAVGSVWCGKCIMFFGSLQKMKGNPSKVLATISNQAKDLSKGFAGIQYSIKDIAARFHECQNPSERDTNVYTAEIEKAFKEAEEARKAADDRCIATREATEKAAQSTGRWGLAMMIPVVNIIAIPDESANARSKEGAAEVAVMEAKRALKEAKTAQD